MVSRTTEKIRQLKDYIENLERWLVEAGQQKICSSCTVACIPIWGKDKSECCEVCDEHETD